jgi:leucyl aminopeptidase
MLDFPDFQPLRITQTTRAPSRKVLDGLDQLAIVLPKRPNDALFRTLPHGQQLAKLLKHAQSHGGERVSSRLTNERATGVTLASFPDGPAWKTLKAARELITVATRDSPARLGLFVAGFSDETRPRIVDHVVAAAAAAAFELPTLRTANKRRPAKLKQLTVLGLPSRLELAPIEAEAYGNNVARWLTLVPPNLLDAAAYRRALEQIASSHGLTGEFYDEARLEKLGAGAFLAVAQGNADRDAGIMHLRYRPKGVDYASLALVGKGIVFDTGGNNLKPFRNMLDMHIDMQGSTVALGTLLALAKLGVPWGADAWLAITENRISATAYKPQDVVRALNGKTIQVIHTDAEGRMVLADTLALAADAKPKLIIDYATLTGTCVSALTENYSGVFSNRAAANDPLLEAGRNSGERVWPFPMDEDFDEPLRSEVADIKQCSHESAGDHILAARFLSKFVPDAIPWVHVDLSAGHRKGGLGHIPSEVTGFGVRFTLELLARGAVTPEELAARFSA